MSKVTFRADDDLVAAVEDLDASKSEVMRNALRAYLTTHAAADDVPVEGVNTPVRGAATDAQKDVNVTIRVSSPSAVEEVRTTPASGGRADAEEPGDDGETDAEHADTSATGDESVCSQCGAELSADHVYCPNCGGKATHRVFCECGDEIRADWAFCPRCGRRTVSGDALDSA
ncbi:MULTISPECIES: zinc-ribbon domain-containing protein [Halobacterium]|uniref:zinc-ribbon domain-containing protein n=1 Tax=Halobacterium TaxID=2239 RepID=UPI0019638962|nr:MULTISPECIES: zinc-ribbon domain-containing protein [Halobacterium]MCF2166114.1 zinc ribbon domain-containing protein [Halobacterium salinarum]MCF2166792.1 zinc ribbon domain-containing protein [Halobacterium salinarum]MCF2239675.1 zinc ribbon domain-containing protein [Halobacterium salinarum]MDL0123135.1 zinc ribbon domain-containing protein [Halobacterium salinarum]MDL0128207.1 zinc ribbon domain-containing protein [Halobacterium salinarum]